MNSIVKYRKMSKKKQPNVSVIMAVYNTECYLEEAINSILTQTFSDLELVIVDDGSSDKCPEILSKYALLDSRIKVITQENSGIGAATQRAISESCGQYIAIMDSDDISLPNRLTLQKQYLDQHPHIDAVGSQWRMLDAQGENAGIDAHPLDSGAIWVLMYAYYSLQHSTTMLRRSAIERIGGYSVDRACLVPDYDLFMRLQMGGCRFANLPEVLFLWNLNPASTTRSKSALQAASVLQIKDDAFSLLLKRNPTVAKSICKSIVYTFPAGSWQDQRIKQFLPESADSLLYKTWLSIPVSGSKESLFRKMVLWLREPAKHHQALSCLLKTQNLPEFSTLVGAHFAAKQLSLEALKVLPEKITVNDMYWLSLFVPFISDSVDFKQRLEQAVSLQLKADFPVELIIFPADQSPLNDAVLSSLPQSEAITIHHFPFGWEHAIGAARGIYFTYLEENFRFNLEPFIALMYSVRAEEPEQLYLFDQYYFSEALDADGVPLIDDRPVPKWSCETLLGKEHLSLSGFIHRRAALKECPAIFRECGSMVSHLLARLLVLQYNFKIHYGVLDYFIPPINLNATPLAAFQKAIINWYFDFGFGQLPTKECWHTLENGELSGYANALSTKWLQGELFLYPGNHSIITQFYLEKITMPMRYPLFRFLVNDNRRTLLPALWNKGAYLNAATATFYCAFYVFRNRLKKLIS